MYSENKKKCRIQQTKVEVEVRLKIPFVYAGIPAAAHPKLFKKN
jgi:predicted secreted Zn-dependent protease